MFSLRNVVYIFSLFSAGVEAQSTMALLGSISGLRNDLLKLFENIEKDMQNSSMKGKSSAFSDKWLSYFGYSTGLSGIVSDLVLNYIGREEFHKKNGSLVRSMKSMTIFLPSHKPKGNEEDVKSMRIQVVRSISEAGVKVFQADGVLGTMCAELKELVANEELVASFVSHLAKGESLGDLLALLDDPNYAHNKDRKTDDEL